MTIPSLTPLSTPPSRTTGNFDDAMDTSLAELDNMVDELIAVIPALNNAVASVASSASFADMRATAAGGARDSAIEAAMNANDRAGDAAGSVTEAIAAKTAAEAARDVGIAARDAAAADADRAEMNANGASLAAGAAATSASQAAATSAKAIRDTLGKFSGIIPPTLNLFCRDATSDAVPIGTFARSIAAYRDGPTGIMETVPAASVRRHCDLAGNLQGWLLEGQATNLIFDSATFNSWAFLGASIVPNAVKAPDGTMTAYKIVEDTSNGFHYMVSNTAVAPNGIYIKQIKVKPAGRSVLVLQLSDYVTSVVIAIYDLVSKTCFVLSGYAPWTDVEAKIEDAEDGYSLCTLTAKKTQGTSASFLLSTALNDGNRTYAGDGSSGLYIWGPQLEAGRYASSLVPSAATAVTRPADVWTIPVSSFKFNASAGSFYIQAMTAKALPQPGLGQMAFMIDDGTWLNLIMLYRYTDEILWLTTLSNGVNIGINCGTFANNVPIRLVMSYNTSLFKVCVNGGNVLKSNFTRMFGLSTLRLGNDLSLTQPWNSTIGHFAHFPQELSDAAMKSITA
ncbi:Phage protein [Desulfovibrio sp. DV]|uniref:phage head spike fiber domain-containing protein n=1 Tax=Desulfovibrio sp. DV TaxID=1844708 RepID=UPI0009618EB7|nr:hypothetical protein [Desulfovibrio sp. DV]OLN31331.1 Phage protein [Desulfovibrio sp. DV]